MISRLHYITQDIPNFTHYELVEEACKGGADWIQLRVKNSSYNEWKELAFKTKKVCNNYNAKLIINDNVDIAKTVNADGVHLGKNDMPSAEARKILGNNFIIGGTANTFEDVERLNQTGVDYIGVGPFRYTTTKEKLSPILGLDGYQNILNKCRDKDIKIPIIAIGGIRPEDISSLFQTGIYGIAVSSAINSAKDKSLVTKQFLEKISKHNGTINNFKQKI
ncbi:MAG: thiamine phosphate synthase [Bacteroidetes bacterium]|nr:thiamine phosphate synthase [Bacteroidota bacterium]